MQTEQLEGLRKISVELIEENETAKIQQIEINHEEEEKAFQPIYSTYNLPSQISNQKNSSNINHEKSWLPENQNNGDKIQNSWLPRNQNMKNKNLTSPKKKGKFFAVKNQGNFKSPQKQVLNPDEIQSMFKNKLPSKKRRPEQYRKDENPRLPKKRRLLARKNAQNHKIPYQYKKSLQEQENGRILE